MKQQVLSENWVLKTEKTGEILAVVPGCVHSDLMYNGYINDLYFRDNNKQYNWIENSDFTYICRFDAKTNIPATLVFEGLDTYCEIYLNGIHIGSANDMFIPYEFDVSDILLSNNNLLEVKFRSPIKEVENEPKSEGAFTTERMRTRRMQCTYGWDWVDRFVTCGIFRPVYIKYGNDLYVDSAYIYIENIDKYSAHICVEIENKNFENGGLLQIEIINPSGEIIKKCDFFCKEKKFVRRFDIQNPELWYPLGYGEHPIYTLSIKVNDNVFTETFGIRTLKILQIEDELNSEYYNLSKTLQTGKIGQIYDKNTEYSGFQVVINGSKILCQGANWVPCEPFPSAETKEKLYSLICMAKEMGINMLRVWGGGIFENKYFYDCCDREGILVVQDFLMACGTYPENEQWFIDLLQKESAFAVKYLRNHPCLAWWNGDNENAQEGSDHLENYRGRTAAFSGIAPAIYEFDHTREFLPSSPYGGNQFGSLSVGTSHNTNYVDKMYDYFYYSDCNDYKEFFSQFIARFIAEEPSFGAVSKKSALKFMTLDDINDNKEEILKYHTKTNPYLKRTVFDDSSTFALKVLGAAENGEDRYFKYKYIQYEWVRIVLENFRRNIGYCNGILFWMFNDCWPAALGWSFVDYYCTPKASFYAFRRFITDSTVSVIKKSDSYFAVVSNKNDNAARISGKAYLFSLINDFKLCDEYDFNSTVNGYSSVSIKLPWQSDDKYMVVCDIESNEKRDRSFYKDGKLEIKKYNDLLVIEKSENTITVRANDYIHVVEFEGEVVFSDNYFSLLPGESKTISWKKITDFSDSKIDITAYTLRLKD